MEEQEITKKRKISPNDKNYGRASKHIAQTKEDGGISSSAIIKTKANESSSCFNTVLNLKDSTVSLFTPLKTGITYQSCSSLQNSQFARHLIENSNIKSTKKEKIPATTAQQQVVITPDSLPDYSDEETSEEEEEEISTPLDTKLGAKSPHTNKIKDDKSRNKIMKGQYVSVDGTNKSVPFHPLQRDLVKKGIPSSPSSQSCSNEQSSNFSFTLPSPPPPPRHPYFTCQKFNNDEISSSFNTEKTNLSPHAAIDPTSFSFTVSSNSEPISTGPGEVAKLRKKPSVPKPLMITESIPTNSLFLSKKSKLLKEIGSSCNIEIAPNNSEIIITGEKHQVDTIKNRLEKEITSFKGSLKTEVICIKAYYAPLFMNGSFVKEINDKFSDIELAVTVQNNSGNKMITIDEFVQLLETSVQKRKEKKLLTLNDVFNLGILNSPVDCNDDKQWFIQSFNGVWDQVPAKTNKIMNDCLCQQSITIEDRGQYFKIDFEEKIAVNLETKFEHPLKSEVLWYYQDKVTSSFIPYSLNECIQIEECYKTYQYKTVQCDNNRICFFNFSAKVEIDTNNGSLRQIKRQPSISPTFLLPSFSITLTGVQTDVNMARENLLKFLQSKIDITSVPCISHCTELLESHARQYCVETSFNTAQNILTIKGVQLYVALVENELRKFQDSHHKVSLSSSSYNVPSEWEAQSKDIELFPVAKGSKEWKNIEEMWRRTMSCSIKSIKRIQNKELWDRYQLRQEQLRKKGCVNEKWLFHGTRKTPPEDIYKSNKAFDFRFSIYDKPGMWGTGSYFAVNASYSAKNYSFKLFMTGDEQIFVARVLTGETIKLAPDTTLKMPPLKNPMDSTSRYDSVKGYTNGSDIYVVYEFDQAYPAYLITF